MNTRISLFLLVVFNLVLSCSNPRTKDASFVRIKTDLGDIRVRLYDETPAHRDNFLHLVASGYYEGISFHRIIKGFMIQAGDAQSRTVSKAADDSLSIKTIAAEFHKSFFHKRGALAAARTSNDINPQMRSSATQFYIVQGKKYDDAELDEIEATTGSVIKQAAFISLYSRLIDSCTSAGSDLTQAAIQEMVFLRLSSRPGFQEAYHLSPDQRNTYKSLGGAPFLDMTYTVFGEVVDGIEIVDKIADVKTDGADKPVNDIRIIKMKIERR